MLGWLTVRFCFVFAEVTKIRLFLSPTGQQRVTGKSGSWLLEGLADVSRD
jgi:hypothetical protein